jgi:predicted transposase/invertase (TIGR01784 family)
MPSKISSVHDKFLKELLSDKEVAIDFLVEFLPKDIVAAIKLYTLEPLNTSYLSASLEETFSDVVWRIQTNEQSLNICLLLEHKSSKDPKVAFQILEYLAQAYRKQLTSKQKRLELIIPVLYYHGKTKWEVKTLPDFFNDYPDIFKKYLPNYSLEFIDLRKLNDTQLLNLQNGMLGSALMVQRNIFESEKLKRNFVSIIKSIEPYLEKNFSNTIFVYMIQFLEISESELNKKIEEIPEILNSKIMSLYDQLLERGRKEGIEKGIEKGRNLGIEEGIEKGKYLGIEEGLEKTVLNAFDNHIALDTIRVITGESLDKINAILKKNGKI